MKECPECGEWTSTAIVSGTLPDESSVQIMVEFCTICDWVTVYDWGRHLLEGGGDE